MPPTHALDRVLALDVAGTPFEWLLPEEAVTLYAKGKVAWDLGGTERLFHGGVNRDGEQSVITIRPIVAVSGSDVVARHADYSYPLGDRGNAMLFKRDRYPCAYCAGVFDKAKLTRDHILARSRGGGNTWMNCVTACGSCNQEKADKLVHDSAAHLPAVHAISLRALHPVRQEYRRRSA